MVRGCADGANTGDLLWPMAILACLSYIAAIRLLHRFKVLLKF
jgi:hypothetical protein